jgi:outer membrane receptor protein involved in Fe transport
VLHRTRYNLMCGAAAIAIAATAGAAHADEKRDFNIAAQPLASALMEFGRQSGAAVVVPGQLTGARTTRGVTASMEPEAALHAMLDGTGLTYRREGELFAIVKADTGPQSGSAAGGGAEVEALIVTAQKREEDIQDVPIAISAFTQEALERSQIAGGPDLITQVPNMTFTKTNFSSYSIQLRGIGTQAISATTDPAVAVAFNNTPFIRNRFFEQEFYDLQRVEVLRGPQGTLYGRNATAGVVNIIPQKPKFLAGAKLSGDIGNFSSSRIEGMINIPLVEDKVALRLAGAWTKRDGYATNELTGNPIDGRNLWSSRLSLRVQPTDGLDVNLVWEHFEEDDDRLRSGKQLCKKDVVTEILAAGTGPGGIGANVTDLPYYALLYGAGQAGLWSGLQATLSQGCERNSLYAEDSFQTPNGLMIPYYVPLDTIGLPAALLDPYASTVQSPNLRTIESTIDPDYRAKTDIAQIQVNWDLTDALTLTSETAYGADWVYSLQDFNRFNTQSGAWGSNGDDISRYLSRGILRTDLGPNLQFCDPQLGCSDRLVAVDVSTATARQFSQELRLASDNAGPFNFSLGGNYLRADSEDKYYVFINSVSMIAAVSGGSGLFDTTTPYIGGVTDNSECLLNGMLPGDANSTYSVSNCTYIDPNPIASVNDLGHNYFLSKNPYKLISYALFGEAYWRVTDTLQVTGGLRWTVDKKEAPRIPTWLLASNSVGYPVADVIEQEWREPTGRFTVDWKPDLGFTDETLVYGSLSHGYKAGGANPPGFVRVFYSDPLASGSEAAAADSATRPRTFKAEFIDALELGTKNTLLDGRLTLNLAAFYYDYKDYQISEIVDRSAFNRNFDANVWGLELESDWRPVENLRIGLKGGYQRARIADGEQAIDLMDRTAGDPAWIVVRPFPTYASSCILPSWMFAHEGPSVGEGINAIPNLYGVGGVGGGNPGGCEVAYLAGKDPVTGRDYEPFPTVSGPGSTLGYWDPGTYPGWNPASAPNGGEGIMKDLSGNALPNAPEWTATVTADYSIPMANDWLATLHTDLHWQSQSYWRLFQDHEYATLDEYVTMNLAAIFANEERGWKIMAYIKNVTDETAISGAFLNSDDTGLTTNVFLTEPRLYGLRVTKEWVGGPLLGSFGQRGDGPFPFTIELGGQVQRHDAPNAALNPSFASEFEAPLRLFDKPTGDDLDWGDGRDVKLTWRPSDGPWQVAAGVRFGQTNGQGIASAQQDNEPVCAITNEFACEYYIGHPKYGRFVEVTQPNWSRSELIDREEHQIVEFTVGRDFGLGRLSNSTISAGLRHAKLSSDTDASAIGIPDWMIPEGFFQLQKVSTRTQYRASLQARREFEGAGPILEWDASLPMVGDGNSGALAIEWSAGAGALLGERRTQVSGLETAEFSQLQPGALTATFPIGTPTVTATSVEVVRNDSVVTPLVDLSVGLGYSLGAFRVRAGYRWERYFDVIDGGFAEQQEVDRTIDGPYFKIAVGFGG